MKGTSLRLVLFVLAGFSLAMARAQEPVAALREVHAVGPVVFDHDFHTDDLELECIECHHETHAGVLDLPHPEYFEDLWIDCQGCHGEETNGDPQACSDCHHEQLVEIANETLSAKVVIHKSCWSCHDMGTGVSASESCAMCHQRVIEPGEKEGADG